MTSNQGWSQPERSSPRWWVVDGGAVDGARALGRVGDHPAVGQPLQAPAPIQPPVVPGAEQAHAIDLGPAAQHPGHLVVALGPFRRPIAARPDAAAVTLGQRPAHLGGRRPVLPAHVQGVAAGADQDRRDLGVAGDPPQRPAGDRSGEGAASPPPPPLRTGRVSFPTSGSSLHFRPLLGGQGALAVTPAVGPSGAVCRGMPACPGAPAGPGSTPSTRGRRGWRPP